jgi:hypothetical protein
MRVAAIGKVFEKIDYTIKTATSSSRWTPVEQFR